MYKKEGMQGDGSNTLLARAGQAAVKFNCPAGTCTCPATLLNKGQLHCEDSPKTLLAKRGKLGSCSAC